MHNPNNSKCPINDEYLQMNSAGRILCTCSEQEVSQIDLEFVLWLESKIDEYSNQCFKLEKSGFTTSAVEFSQASNHYRNVLAKFQQMKNMK